MTDTQTDIEIVQNATYRLAVTWTDNSTPPVAKSLAGYYAHMQFRPRLGATGTPLINLSSLITLDTTGTSIDPAITLEPGGNTGVVSIRVGADLTNALRKNCYYDLFLINLSDPSDSVRLIQGAVTVDPSVTSPELT